MKFAAIDIGSNAVRCLFANVIENEGTFIIKKESLIRVPLRLGSDVFNSGTIPDSKTERLLHALQGFKYLMDAYECTIHRACATSAMRDARNSKSVIKKIRQKTGISIEVISGKEEAELIYNTHVAEFLDPQKSFMYIDVGGGSTEIIFFSDMHKVNARSFNIGTIRIINEKIHPSDWKIFKDFIKTNSEALGQMAAIGSGGSLSKAFNILTPASTNLFLTLNKLKRLRKELKKLTLEERMQQFDLGPDRADVIIPALSIYIRAMKWADIKKIYVPRKGLVDGIVNNLIENHWKA